MGVWVLVSGSTRKVGFNWASLNKFQNYLPKEPVNSEEAVEIGNLCLTC